MNSKELKSKAMILGNRLGLPDGRGPPRRFCPGVGRCEGRGPENGRPGRVFREPAGGPPNGFPGTHRDCVWGQENPAAPSFETRTLLSV
jgi:hypothetical protein